ncbi:hypothetical protein C8J57DRAFT_1471414, partial [Mycena rebaudengoi]
HDDTLPTAACALPPLILPHLTSLLNTLPTLDLFCSQSGFSIPHVCPSRDTSNSKASRFKTCQHASSPSSFSLSTISERIPSSCLPAFLRQPRARRRSGRPPCCQSQGAWWFIWQNLLCSVVAGPLRLPPSPTKANPVWSGCWYNTSSVRPQLFQVGQARRPSTESRRVLQDQLGRSHGASRLEDHRRRHSCCPGLAPRCPIVVVLEPTPDDFNR